MDATEALAEVCASIDGKLEEFRQGKDADPVPPDGVYEGYIAEAEEMISRLRSRGFVLLPFGRWRR